MGACAGWDTAKGISSGIGQHFGEREVVTYGGGFLRHLVRTMHSAGPRTRAGAGSSCPLPL